MMMSAVAVVVMFMLTAAVAVMVMFVTAVTFVLVNVQIHAGFFAADRSIEEYARRIWRLEKIK